MALLAGRPVGQGIHVALPISEPGFKHLLALQRIRKSVLLLVQRPPVLFLILAFGFMFRVAYSYHASLYHDPARQASKGWKHCVTSWYTNHAPIGPPTPLVAPLQRKKINMNKDHSEDKEAETQAEVKAATSQSTEVSRHVIQVAK